jgi:AcrR family transcriptional regulator
MTTTPFHRARTELQRAERREAILTTAAAMLQSTRVAELSLNELARQVGLAKSNVLRYFESREAVLLELYDREYIAWLDALEAELCDLPTRSGANGAEAPAEREPAAEGPDARGEPAVASSGHEIDAAIERVAAAIAETVAERPVLCDLCASAPGVLEHNVSAEIAGSYKRSAVAAARRLADMVGPRVGGFSDPSAITFVGGVNLVIGGVWAMSQPSPGMAAAYAADAELRAMQLDLRLAVRELVATLLVGLRHRRPSGQPSC